MVAVVLAGWFYGVPSVAQTVSGTIFEDRNGNGIHDAGEPLLEGVGVNLFGSPDAGGTWDQSTATGPDGAWSFAPGDGCYVMAVDPGADFRPVNPRSDLYPEGGAPFPFPVVQPRFGLMENGVTALKAGAFRYAALGDSIGWNFNFCGYTSEFWYSRQIRDRLQCTAPVATVDLDENAVKGEHTDDLLVDDGASDGNNVFSVIARQPQKVTISIIGNDLLGVDPAGAPSQAEINRAVAEVLDSRQNLQETLSVMISEVPGVDIALNTLYDNLSYGCYDGIATSAFHRTWVPIMNQVLRDLAWGQIRPVAVSEVAAEFAIEDLDGNPPGSCTGFDRMICRDLFQFDQIHPTNDGYRIIREKVWESSGGVLLGTSDAASRSALSDVDFGMLRRVRRIYPTRWQVLGGAQVALPEAAFSDSDAGIPAAITLGAGQEEFVLSGFPDWFDEIQIVRVVSGVRYRTTGTVADDFYRMESSVSGVFRAPPGHPFTPLDWNFYTPIVGGGGPNAPATNADYPNAELLALPDVGTWRDVSATLTKNPVQNAGSTQYDWPALTHAELATTAIRVASAPVAGTVGNDGYSVELDAAWLDLYGYEKARPQEITGVRLGKGATGELEIEFDALAGSQRYNLYFGRLGALPDYDHGTAAQVAPDCDAGPANIGGGRLQMVVAPAGQPGSDAYFLVTAHVDDVESPSGTDSDGGEIDRSQSDCR